MNPAAIIHRLEQFPQTLCPMLLALPEEDYRWKPAPEHWSILEICCHLLDEEREDFRARLASTLEDPSRAWPALELKGIAERRSYNTRDLPGVLADFIGERLRSVGWLLELKSPDYGKAYIHAKFGPITAGQLLASWAAHDALHLRQIAKRLHGLARRDGSPHDVAYAGEWSA
jgi:DinB superfamily